MDHFGANITRPPCLHPALRTSEAVTATLGLLLNVTLALLIVSRTEKELRPYGRVLLCNCCVDGVFSLLAYVFEIHTDIREGIYVIVSNGFSVGTYEQNLLLQTLQIFDFYFATAVVCVPMVYRYLAVCRQHHLSHAQLALLIITIATISSLSPLCVYVFWGRASARTMILHLELIRSMPCSDPGEVYMFMPAEVLSNLDAIPTLLAAGFIVGSAYGVIIFCALNTLQAAAHLESMTIGRRNLHKQLNYALLVQVTIPLVLFVLPVGGVITALLIGFGKLSFFVVTITTVLSFIPILSLLSTIFLIKSYRHSLCSVLTLGGRLVPKKCNASRSAGNNSISRGPTIGRFTAAIMSSI